MSQASFKCSQFGQSFNSMSELVRIINNSNNNTADANGYNDRKLKSAY